MSDESDRNDAQTGEKPVHTAEEAAAFDEQVRATHGFSELAATRSIEENLEQTRAALQRNDTDEVNRLYEVRMTWASWLVVVAAILIIAIGVFYFGSGANLLSDDGPATSATEPANGTAPDPAGDTPADAAPAADEPAAAPADPQPAEPALFSGTISADNGWFVITVAEDGSAAGTLNVAMDVDGGTVTQTGTFAGSIDDQNVVTCAGAFTGVSVDADGREYPHSGTVSILAVPTSEDLTTWDITADGDPGDAVTLPGTAN